MISFLLVILVPIALLLTLVAISVRPVRAREGAVVCQGLTGGYVGLTIGPRFLIVLPILDTVHMIDLSFHRTTLNGLTMQTFDGQTAVATITVGWQLDAKLLRAADIEQILPFLPRAEQIVSHWTEFVTRATISRYKLDAIQNILRHPRGFQEVLAEDLRRQIKTLGACVLDVQLMCYVSPAVAEARIAAEARAQELQIVAAARAHEIRLLSEALHSSRGNDDLIQLLTLDMLRDGNKHVLTTFDMSRTRSGNGSTPVQFVVGRD